MKQTLFTCIAILMMLASCKSQKLTIEPVDTQQPVAATPASYIPRAVIYKTNGDWNANVMIRLADDGATILSYPAPSDVSAASEPLPVGNGWLLDRRGGISEQSAFLTYTYAQYAALPAPPSLQTLRDSIIPNAHVTAVRTLPITLSQALSDPSSIKEYIE